MTLNSQCSRNSSDNNQPNPHESISIHMPQEDVYGRRRNITCGSPLVRIFRWFVTLFDFLLIEWMFSLDNLSLSDSSSSFFLYFRTEMEECNHISEHMQHRKCVFHPKNSRSIFKIEIYVVFDPLMQVQYVLAPLPRHEPSCPTHWSETQLSRGLSSSKLEVHLPSTLKKSLTLEKNSLSS